MKASKRFKGKRDKELSQIPTECMGTSKVSYARKREKKRQLVIKSLFEELFNFLPDQNVSRMTRSRMTRKTILLDTAAYIITLEMELGLRKDINWENHFETLSTYM